MCVTTGTVDRSTIELDGLVTSISASVARAVPSGVKAKTICTACGNRWRNSPLAIIAFYGGAVLVFDHLAPRP